MKPLVTAAIITALSVTACGKAPAEKTHSIQYTYSGPAYATPAYDEAATIEAMKILSADDMQGRAAGTAGGRKAAAYIIAQNEDLMRAYDGLTRPFTREIKDGPPVSGMNIGMLFFGQAREYKDPTLIITAHYDHLGIKDGETFNGADDNASGAAALFAIAQSFNVEPPKHNVIILWLDAEEEGLSGAKAFIEEAGYFDGAPIVNLNLDMISQSSNGELYMAGTYHTPAFGPLMAQAAYGTELTLKFGHDRPELGYNDWTSQSDHGVFHAAGIPFVYFGVEDHPHYHKATDTFETIPIEFYKQSLKTVVNAAHILDDNLAEIAKPAIKPKDD